ncbi:hypothetical protein FKG94_20560 [Exilibacterium tricleocarpae]|uniref:Uncharacterized protein n=1 Tax=Exilibacterium tricleocarpae TaxID=2591008 RepID=A0A545T0H4_9GAMM|nr:hypothetical protein [Exilibacterium tricleocarpae]TQV70724.1 hypothetical protein FKG94_20560 [Exilibacterium tricleocarpae]
MRKMILVLSLLWSVNGIAAGYTPWAVPTQIEYVHGGILVSGSFGDINGCGESDLIYISPSPNDPEVFRTMTSLILVAFTSKKEVRFFTRECIGVNMHWSGTPINAAHNSGFYIR